MKPSPSFVLQKQLLFIVGIGLFIDYFLLTVVIPILPQVFSKNDFSERDIGYMFSSKPAMQFITNIFMGAIVDKCGANSVLFGTTLVLALSTGLFINGLQRTSDGDLDYGYEMCIAARSVQGMASSGIMAGGMALIAENHDLSIHGKAMSIAVSGIAGGIVFGPPLGGIISHCVHIYTPFYIVLGILIINLLAQCHYHYKRRKSDSQKALLTSYGTFMDSKGADFHPDFHGFEESNTIDFQVNQTGGENGSENEEHSPCIAFTSSLRLLRYTQISIVVLGSTLGCFSIGGMMAVILPLFLIKEYKYGKLDQGIIFATVTVSYLFATPVSGVLSDIVKKWKIIGLGAIFTGIGMILLYWSQYLEIVIIGLLFTGAGVAFVELPLWRFWVRLLMNISFQKVLYLRFKI